MRVFISWSGDRSKRIGDALRKWLPGVLQAVKPYFSPDDVAKGARWSGEISKELEASRVGILVLTRENLVAPWLMFEAGALAKNLDRSKVCPLLFGLEPTDITGPLVQFQAARFENAEFKRVVKMINAELGDGALPPEVLDAVFEMWWPRLEAAVGEELGRPNEAEEGPRPERDILEEVLSLTRSLSRDARLGRIGGNHPAVDDLVNRYSALIRAAGEGAPVDPTVVSAVQALEAPIAYLARHSRRGGTHGSSSLRELERAGVIRRAPLPTPPDGEST